MPSPFSFGSFGKRGRCCLFLIFRKKFMGYATDYTTLLSGSYWSGDEVTGQPVILTYSFDTAEPGSDPHNLGSGLNSFTPFTAAQQSQTEQALARWAGVSGIVFEQVAAGKGDINFAAYNLTAAGIGDVGGEGYFPWGNWNYSTETSSSIHFSADIQSNGYGDVLMNTAVETNGLFAYPTLLHEIGHALGLKHPTDAWTDGALNVVHNQWDPSVSYNPNFSIMSPGGLGSTLTDITSNDISAIQSIYGTSAQRMAQYASWGWNTTTYTLTGTLKAGGQTVRGTSINNNITGGSGDDTIYAIGQGTNYIYGTAGDDTLVGGSGVNFLNGGAGADTLNGWFSVNTYASYADSTAGLTVNLLYPWLNTGDAKGDVYVDVHKALGSNYADNITGDNSGDILKGGAGDDTITGGAGADYLYGQAGNDTLIAGAGTSFLDGGAGADTLVGSAGHPSYASYSDATTAVTVNLLNPSLNKGDAAGDSYTNIRDLLGSSYSDNITGDNSGDILKGGLGDDVIVGGTGNDAIFGGAGADTLTGGGGANQFSYNAPSEGGDTITDFSAVQGDLITVLHSGFGGGLVAGKLPAADFALNAPTAAIGQFVWIGASSALYWDPDGTGPEAATLIATLQNVTTFAASGIKVT
jgi:Ca2+-binding RTX toxin-like protein